jgi:hypothetical protein
MDADVRRKFEDLSAGHIAPVGEVELEQVGTETEVITRACSSTSAVLLSAIDSGAAAAWGSVYTTSANGSFTITHPVFVGVRTFRWVVVTGSNIA